MREEQKRNNPLKSVLNAFKSKKTLKTARITYQVAWNLLLLVIIFLVIGTAFAGGVGAGYVAALVKDEPIRSYDSMKKDIYNYEEVSEIYFANNEYLGKVRTDLEREEVSLKDVSQYLIDAVIATEDEYFYEHNGIVPKAIMRALLQEVSNSSIQSGGSTLTQQLIKNQILTNEVSFQRKAKEILLALRLEHFFDKDEILEAYLNVSTFGRNSSGRNIAGVQSAAKGIFGKTAKELTLPQAAFIAGLPQSPFGYTPFTNQGERKTPEGTEPGITRMKTVLKRMYDGNEITKEEYESAVNYDITQDFIPPETNPLESYPFLTNEIEKRAKAIIASQLAKNDGYTDEDLKNNQDLQNEYNILADRQIRRNGYQIHSTIDKKLYDTFQEVVRNYKSFGPDKPEKVLNTETNIEEVVMQQVETGAVLMENSTGKILSFVGGRNFEKSQTSHITAPRQNGSTMKPLLVYAPAIELGFASPGTILPDVPLKLDPSNPDKIWPRNYNSSKFSGLVSARNALAQSYNVPAVKLYTDILPQRPATFLEKMGFTTLTPEDYVLPSIAIGSLKIGVSVEENTNAFATFANGGQFIDAYMIEKITDKEGNVIYQHETKPVEVFSPQTAYLTLDMMRDVLNNGTGRGLKGRLKFSSDWFAKTGTGNEYIDSWLVAGNPKVTMGIWTGYDTPKSLYTTGMSYSQRTNYLWTNLMNGAYDVAPDIVKSDDTFKMPGGIVQRSFCAVSGLLPSEACQKAGLVDTDLFNEKFVPTKTDDSLIDGNFVTINNVKYLALESTPKEFTGSGMVLNAEYIQKLFGIKTDPKSLLPSNSGRWSNIMVTAERLMDNGKPPAPLTIQAANNVISWGRHSENDVIGYRVYNSSGAVIASIKADDNLSFHAGNGSYYVKAVDIAGQESVLSNIVHIGNQEQPGGNTNTGNENGNPSSGITPVPPTNPNPIPEPPPENTSGTEDGNGQ
ncbi:penicillin-binding protein [Bacillaceae bacterium Marseille-Q3522]|nr:penicillin-binding protein [Bacillaceae bacterium Marseille-Q3522]